MGYIWYLEEDKNSSSSILVLILDESCINGSCVIISIFSCEVWHFLLGYKTGRAVTCAVGDDYCFLTC